MAFKKKKEIDVEPNPFLVKAIVGIVVGLGLFYWGFFGLLGIMNGSVSFNSTTIIFAILPLMGSPISIYYGYCCWKLYKTGYRPRPKRY